MHHQNVRGIVPKQTECTDLSTPIAESISSSRLSSSKYMMDEMMVVEMPTMKTSTISGCRDLTIAPTNIWMPIEYRPNLKTRKTRTSRTIRTKPNDELAPSPVASCTAPVIQKGIHATRSIRFIGSNTKWKRRGHVMSRMLYSSVKTTTHTNSTASKMSSALPPYRTPPSSVASDSRMKQTVDRTMMAIMEMEMPFARLL
mmetsp:Transcript_5896/g.15377  ORF Transcript_5896/g.15377 Transcript_5896/m.15377 type:complete len:200 (+) Transcript_5896:1103-1702(+)